MYVILTRYGRNHLLMATFNDASVAHSTRKTLNERHIPNVLFTNRSAAEKEFKRCDGNPTEIDALLSQKQKK